MTTDSIEPDFSRNDIHGLHRPTIPASASDAEAQASNGSPGGKLEAHHRHQIFWMRLASPAPTIEAVRGASAQALVSEIEACARNFFETGDNASIDLRCLKAMPEEREILASMLGEGEVSAVVDAGGRTEIRETSVPCVWWVRHRDPEGETVGELIEITAIPDLIVGDREAVFHGLEALNAALQFHMPGAVEHPHFNAR